MTMYHTGSESESETDFIQSSFYIHILFTSTVIGQCGLWVNLCMD